MLFDLKSGELTHQDMGQMDMYVRMVDDLKRGPDDNPAVALFCAPTKTHRWSGTPCCMRMSICSPANTSWYCPLKMNCVRSLSGSALRWKSNGSALPQRPEDTLPSSKEQSNRCPVALRNSGQVHEKSTNRSAGLTESAFASLMMFSRATFRSPRSTPPT